MENEKKKTDFQILYDYLIERGFWDGDFTPFEMIKAALSFLSQIKANNTPISIDLFFNNTYEVGNRMTKPAYYSEESHYSFIIAIYILAKAEGCENEYQRDLICDIEKLLQSEERAQFDLERVNKVVQQIKEFRLSAPKFYNPMDDINEIANGKNPSDVDWSLFLPQMLRFAGLSKTNFPYFITLHTFLIGIPDTMQRVEILEYLKREAPNCLDDQQAQLFITDANMLVPTYVRIRDLMKENRLPTVWKNDVDLNEFVLYMNNIKPEELVALSQVILDYRKIKTEREGILAHVLRMPHFIGKIVTNSGLEFCQGLYYAIGDIQWIQSGHGEDYMEMPTMDTQSTRFMNQCYQLFINHRIAQLREQFVKEHHHDAELSRYLVDIYKDLEFEYDECFTEGYLHMNNSKAYQSLKARFNDLIGYTINCIQIEQDKEDAQQRNDKFMYIISDDDDEIIKIHKRIEMYILSPAKLRDELIRLQEEKLVSLPMDNPTAIIRAIRRIWGKDAPKERSFVTTWGRRL